MIERKDTEHETYDRVVDQRLEVYGKTIGTWCCNNEECKAMKKSFLYNFELHIPLVCDVCDKGEMYEDDAQRESPMKLNFVKGKQGEDEWLAKQPPSMQADVLLGRDPTY